MNSVPNPHAPEAILRAGIDRALVFLDNKKPGRARYTLTRAVIQYDRAKLVAR